MILLIVRTLLVTVFMGIFSGWGGQLQAQPDIEVRYNAPSLPVVNSVVVGNKLIYPKGLLGADNWLKSNKLEENNFIKIHELLHRGIIRPQAFGSLQHSFEGDQSFIVFSSTGYGLIGHSVILFIRKSGDKLIIDYAIGQFSYNTQRNIILSPPFIDIQKPEIYMSISGMKVLQPKPKFSVPDINVFLSKQAQYSLAGYFGVLPKKVASKVLLTSTSAVVFDCSQDKYWKILSSLKSNSKISHQLKKINLNEVVEKKYIRKWGTLLDGICSEAIFSFDCNSNIEEGYLFPQPKIQTLTLNFPVNQIPLDQNISLFNVIKDIKSFNLRTVKIHSVQERFRGEFINGELITKKGTSYSGQGLYCDHKNRLYEGELEGGVANGVGQEALFSGCNARGKRWIKPLGDYYYIGEFKKGVPDGYGSFYSVTPYNPLLHQDEAKYLIAQGWFKKGKFHGEVARYDPAGRFRSKGMYKHGNLVKSIVYYKYDNFLHFSNTYQPVAVIRSTKRNGEGSESVTFFPSRGENKDSQVMVINGIGYIEVKGNGGKIKYFFSAPAKKNYRTSQYEFEGPATLTSTDGGVLKCVYTKKGFSGPATLTTTDGNVLKGIYTKKGFSGPATLIYKNGNVLKGIYTKNGFSGPATLTTTDGDVLKGIYTKNGFSGPATLTTTDGDVLKGIYTKNGFSGPAIFTTTDGEVLKGIYTKKGFSGPATLIYKNGNVLKGIYTKNGFSGPAKFYWKKRNHWYGTNVNDGSFNIQYERERTGVFEWTVGLVVDAIDSVLEATYRPVVRPIIKNINKQIKPLVDTVCESMGKVAGKNCHIGIGVNIDQNGQIKITDSSGKVSERPIENSSSLGEKIRNMKFPDLVKMDELVPFETTTGLSFFDKLPLGRSPSSVLNSEYSLWRESKSEFERFSLLHTKSGAIRNDEYGSGYATASRGPLRTHGAIDYKTTINEPIYAGIVGVVEHVWPTFSKAKFIGHPPYISSEKIKIFHVNVAGQEIDLLPKEHDELLIFEKKFDDKKYDYKFYKTVTIRTDSGARVQLSYVNPIVEKGDKVNESTIIGTSQDLHFKYILGMTNHVHVKYIESDGSLYDPVTKRSLKVIPAKSNRTHK